jgi:hypothetical protein
VNPQQPIDFFGPHATKVLLFAIARLRLGSVIREDRSAVPGTQGAVSEVIVTPIQPSPEG